MKSFSFLTQHCSPAAAILVVSLCVAFYSCSPTLAESGAATEVFGVTTAVRQARLQAHVNGAVTSILVEEGQFVDSGVALLVIDDRIPRAELAGAKASAESFRLAQRRAELELELTTTRYRNMAAAHRAGAGTDAELLEIGIRRDQASAARAEAKAKWDEALQMVALAEARLHQHTVRAPFAGRIVRLRARLGERPDPQQSLIDLLDDSQLKVEFHAPVEWFASLHLGESYVFNAESPVDENVSAKLLFVQPSIDAPTRTFRCVFTMDNDGIKIPAGLAVRWSRPKRGNLATTRERMMRRASPYSRPLANEVKAVRQ